MDTRLINNNQQSAEAGATQNANAANGKFKVSPRVMKIGAAGIGGVVVGTAAIFAANHLNAKSTDIAFADDDLDDVADDAAEITAIEPDEVVETEHETTMPLAELTDGNVGVAAASEADTFRAAFQAARAEVGPGGTFEWHGTVYGTYTADEWNALSPAQQQEWAAHFNWKHINNSTPAGHSETGALEGREVSVAPTTEPDSDVDEDGEYAGSYTVHGITREAGTGRAFINVTVDGHEAIVVDNDGDGIADAMILDANDNGEIDEGEISDISEAGISIEGLASSAGDIQETLIIPEDDGTADLAQEVVDNSDVDDQLALNDDIDISDTETLDI